MVQLYIKQEDNFIPIYPVKELSKKYAEVNSNYFTQLIKYKKYANYKIGVKMYVDENVYKKLSQYAELNRKKRAL